MPTDVTVIVDNLRAFYDMTGKSVLHVGAGGGQLIGYAHGARSVLAVDPDPAAVSRLETALREAGLEDRFIVVQGEFASVSDPADVVFFEFCLHEMARPVEALQHARSLSPEIVIVDHVPDSRWAWHTCEEEKAARSWGAVRQHRIVREASFEALQRFSSYAELVSKLEVLGEQAIARCRSFSGREEITIEMKYAMALIA